MNNEFLKYILWFGILGFLVPCFIFVTSKYIKKLDPYSNSKHKLLFDLWPSLLIFWTAGVVHMDYKNRMNDRKAVLIGRAMITGLFILSAIVNSFIYMVIGIVGWYIWAIILFIWRFIT